MVIKAKKPLIPLFAIASSEVTMRTVMQSKYSRPRNKLLYQQSFGKVLDCQ